MVLVPAIMMPFYTLQNSSEHSLLLDTAFSLQGEQFPSVVAVRLAQVSGVRPGGLLIPLAMSRGTSQTLSPPPVGQRVQDGENPAATTRHFQGEADGVPGLPKGRLSLACQ